jgi:hypothetical protein
MPELKMEHLLPTNAGNTFSTNILPSGFVSDRVYNHDPIG